MSLKTSAKIWAGQVRAPFLVLSVFLTLIGGAVAHQDGAFDWLRFVLTAVGVTLAHVAVNVFNELSDHKTGIDFHTNRTPFSGGSGSLQNGLTTPRSASIAAFSSLFTALAIGLYLAYVSGWPLMIFVFAGGLASYFYTSHMAKWMLGELAAGACLGTFVVIGTYYAQTSTITPAVVWLSVPPGILTALLLFLNEFPDVEADMAGGRKHLVIALGRKRAALVYAAALTASYLILVAGVIMRWFPATVLLSLLTLPLAVKAVVGAVKHGADVQKLVPAMGANVAVVLGTDFLIALAYFIH